jgi:hypothetical protein
MIARMRKLREVDGLGNTAIAKILGCDRHSVERYAARFGWGTGTPGAKPKPVFQDGEPCPGLAGCPKRSTLVARLLADLAARVQEYEARPHGPDTAEADAKLLGVFAQTLARLIELDRDAGDSHDSEDTDGPAAVAELARRLSRLAEREG